MPEWERQFRKDQSASNFDKFVSPDECRLMLEALDAGNGADARGCSVRHAAVVREAGKRG